MTHDDETGNLSQIRFLNGSDKKAGIDLIEISDFTAEDNIR